jgi:hypothetical protein
MYAVQSDEEVGGNYFLFFLVLRGSQFEVGFVHRGSGLFVFLQCYGISPFHA